MSLDRTTAGQMIMAHGYHGDVQSRNQHHQAGTFGDENHFS